MPNSAIERRLLLNACAGIASLSALRGCVRQNTPAVADSSDKPLFSLVVGTKGRDGELVRLLDSLAVQTCTDFEVIIVDQNADERVRPLLGPFRSRLRLEHQRVGFSGLSRARNAGLENARGRLIAFPDDDCWFAPDALEVAARRLDESPELDGICGRSLAPDGLGSQLRSGPRPRMVNCFNVWHLAISYTVFLKRRFVESVGEFDETLGVGAGTPWGSGEETDYLLRGLARGCSLRYDPRPVVFHPEPLTGYSEQVLQRGFSYGAGMGRVLRKNCAPLWFSSYLVFRAIAGGALALGRLRVDEALFHWQVLRGRLHGLCSTPGPAGGRGS